MPKIKTHKAMSKKFNKLPSGKVKIGKPGSNHKTGKKPRSYNRKCREGSLLSKADQNRVKKDKF